MAHFKKSSSKVEAYEATIQHKVHLLISEDKDFFNAYISFDNYGYTRHLVGAPKQYHNDVTGEDVVNTKASFLEMAESYIDDDTIYWYFKDIEKLEAEYEE